MSGAVAANVTSLWVYLSESALLWLAVTLAAFLIGNAIFEWAGRNPIANPQPIAAALICVILVATGTSYTTYFAGARWPCPCSGICPRCAARSCRCSAR
jgi:hypothetical protein